MIKAAQAGISPTRKFLPNKGGTTHSAISTQMTIDKISASGALNNAAFDSSLYQTKPSSFLTLA
jgi:hypothetical protein